MIATLLPGWIFLALALAAGLALPLQAGINGQLARVVGHPVLSAFFSFVVGSVSLAVYALVARLPWPQLDAVSRSNPLVWTGGVLGAFFVTATVILVPELGATGMSGLIIAGQMLGSVLLDHFGVGGFAPHAVSLWRLVGVALIVVGSILVLRF